jgi:hypothetical protein
MSKPKSWKPARDVETGYVALEFVLIVAEILLCLFI